jgi:[ribosomal protein S18]-alanine N-acetyltransferase
VPRGRRTIVGYAGLWFTAGEAHVTNVAVDPAQQRTGVATALLLALADEAIRRGCTAWTLEVRVSSTGAQELYRRFGFVPAGVRSRYYENTEDAIVMWCNDIQDDEYQSLLARVRAELESGRS